MDELKNMIEARFSACKNHPQQQEIFKLEKLLLEAGYPYYFNVWEDLRPVFGGEKDGDPESINWDEYNFLIEVGRPAGCGYSEISVCLNTNGDPTLLQLLDMRPATGKENPTASDGKLYFGLTAEAAKEIIEKFFETA